MSKINKYKSFQIGVPHEYVQDNAINYDRFLDYLYHFNSKHPNSSVRSINLGQHEDDFINDRYTLVITFLDEQTEL